MTYKSNQRFLRKNTGTQLIYDIVQYTIVLLVSAGGLISLAWYFGIPF